MLGFRERDYEMPAGSLSGGQKKMLALARLALEQPDVLLLDEPDNHLDLRGKRFLESFIHNYPGAVVIVSHDRYLLDEVVTQIAELENGELAIYPGNYSAYKAEREIRRLRQQQRYAAQQKEIARIEAAIQRFEHWARLVVNERHIRQARSRRKTLERMEARGEIIAKVTEGRVMDIQIPGSRGSTKAIELIDLGMGFDGRDLFNALDLVIFHGDRVGLVGPNGSGKSVLLKVIRGEIPPVSGEVRIGPSTNIGYYAQENQTLNGWWERTPLDFVRHVRPMPENTGVARLLKFAFVYDQVRMPIRTLSGGERGRLQLLAMMLQEPNCLLLDEPTNNLDIASMEALESALEDFNGALVIISHDRFFLDETVDQVIELKDGRLTRFEGGYTDYVAERFAA
jgi:ATP-binding cassette subfamily F protein 3